MSAEHVVLIPGREARKRHGNLGPTAWNDRVAKRLVTRPVKNGKLNMWPEHELEAIARAHIRGYDDTAIRLLVEDLEAQRLKLEVRA